MKPRQDVYDTYWKLAAERQEIFFKKLKGLPPPFTKDPILNTYKFCNTYRASDRVSQFLIKDVIYGFKTIEEDTLFRTFFFRLLNKIETWSALEQKLDRITLKNFDVGKYTQAIEGLRKSGQAVYGNAFILCANKAFGYDKKHENHLALLEHVFVKTKKALELINSKSLEDLFKNLRELPLIGNFMAYQIAIDFNYSEVFNFSENDFTIAGPGAIRGIRKCFESTNGKDNDYVISHMVENQEKEFERLGIKFKDLWGRSMHAIDCQGMFCETDKYSRVHFPDLKSNRTKIKTKFKPSPNLISYFYPP
ncbi:MAG: putative DNA base hypermodification protein, partial [bacterium]|nr:putative DNA base hypermodification protein [bacterium]